MYFFNLHYNFSFKPELDEFLQDLDEDVEGMQSTIYFLQNELKKYKPTVQNSGSTEKKETNSKALNGIKKKDDIIASETPSISEIKTPIIVESKSDNKSSKHVKPKDPNLINCKSSRPKVKKSRPAIPEKNADQSGKIPKVHKSKHKSDGSKTEAKHNKSEKRPQSQGEVVLKKTKGDRPKSTEVNTPVTTVNGLLPNGS